MNLNPRSSAQWKGTTPNQHPRLWEGGEELIPSLALRSELCTAPFPTQGGVTIPRKVQKMCGCVT